MLKQRLQHKLLQKLSPQQIQLIKLLEVPALELEQRVKEELEVNPALEEGRGEDEETATEDENNDDNYTEKDADKEEFTADDYYDDDEVTPSYKLQANNYSKDDKHVDIPFSVGESFHEHLNTQLGLRSLRERESNLAQYIIGNIDDDGYLRRDLESIVDDLAFQYIETDESELYTILTVIQDLDPAGVGARTLKECLLIQIDKKIREKPNKSELQFARKILRNHFNEFTKKHYQKIIERVNISEYDLKLIIEEIVKLNPKPGGSYSSPLAKMVQAIMPDFLLEDVDGKFILSMNSSNMPELHVSRTYSIMLDDLNIKKKDKNKTQKDTIKFIKQKVDSAKWFIEAIKQRQETLLGTMEAILAYQRKFFISGEETDLRPMILKDIAEVTGLDISTVSRVANSKYIQTPYGIYTLKFFFSEGMTTTDGEEVSTREIKQILKNCIAVENKKKPLTDEKLAIILKEKSYNIARRTVAKYREQLDIPVARLRKEL
ncbi:MAG: RNA polymerase factor sigma-54 [Bacteroidales bacterium]|nr:RNA polymerase factor sigma-54 [Bacteroidales bacterium]